MKIEKRGSNYYVAWFMGNDKVSIGGKTYSSFRILVSYGKIIGIILKDGQIYLDENYWDYSQSTRKHRNDFLRLSNKETKLLIDRGTIKLTDLNI